MCVTHAGYKLISLAYAVSEKKRTNQQNTNKKETTMFREYTYPSGQADLFENTTDQTASLRRFWHFMESPIIIQCEHVQSN